jgi:hypothetical protein
MIRYSRIALVLIAALFEITLSLLTTSAQATKQPGPIPPGQLEEYAAYAALWRTDGDFRSTIRISNQLATTEIDAVPTIYMADGTAWDLPSVHLAKSGVSTVDINDAIANAPDSIRQHLSTYGSARITYQYAWQGAVYATISILDLVRSLDYTVSFVFPPDQGKGETFLPKELRAGRDAANGTRYEGLWFREGHNGGGFLALSNTTDFALSADVQLSGMRNNEDRKAVIQGHSTVLLDLRDMFGTDDTRVGGITITHSGKSGALQVIGGLEDLTTGYSANMPLVPIIAKTKTSTSSVRQYGSAGLMVNEQNSRLGFPDGVRFVPYAFFRNLSAEARTVHVVAYYAEGNTTTPTRSIALPDLTLQPGQAQELNVRDVMKNRPEISDISLLITYTGDYGDILSATGSTDGTGNYVFPVVPQAVGPSGSKTSIYWEVAGGFDTMYTIWNPTNSPQELVAVVHYGKTGEKFTLPLHLNEYASAMLDIGELIRTQQSDQDGNIIPQETHRGSLEVSPASKDLQDVATFILAGGIYNPRKATCGSTCETCSGVTEWNVVPRSFSIPISQSSQAQFHLKMAWGDEYYPNEPIDWASWNTSVASVQTMGDSHPGLITGVGAGSTTITAQYNNTLPINVGALICTSPPAPMPPCPTPNSWSGSASVTVAPSVSISGPSNVAVAANGTSGAVNTIQLTATGNPAGGTYSWTTTSSAVTLINASSATVTVQGKSGGDATIKVAYTLNGQEGDASQSVTAQQPTGLGASVSSTDYDCSRARPALTYTTRLAEITYTVLDQSGRSIAFSNIPVAESFSNSNNNCQDVSNYPEATSGLTLSNGQFPSPDTIGMCSPSCMPADSGGHPLGSCTDQFTQQWTANGFAVQTKTVAMTCPGPPTVQ